MQPFLRFIKYNNAFPIAISFLLLSFGGALAASPDVRETVGDAVISEQQQVLSIDNTYIANKDLASYTPRVQITGVTEDEENYYVAYTFTTIDVVDHVWKDVTEERVMTVAKSFIAGRDLGLYVTEQLKQVIDHEVAYLSEVQGIERKQVTQKVVATAYSGLVGAFLDDRTEVLPGYTPVVTPPAPPLASSDSEGEPPSGVVAGASTEAPSGGDTTPPSVQILGANPARILIGTSYSDLGAVVTDNVNQNLGYAIEVDGKALPEVSIDTSKAATHTIRYTATDQAGNKAHAERTVEVYEDPNVPRSQTGTPAQENGATSTEPILEPTPEPTPEPLPPTSSDTSTSS